MKTETIVNGKLKDLNTILFGKEDASDMTKSHMVKQARNDTMIHFVKSGKGYLEFEQEHYEITEGYAFIVTSGIKYRYFPDENDPWEVSWVVFNGELSEDFKNVPPVVKLSHDIVERMDAAHNASGRKDILLGLLLMQIYYELIDEELISQNDRIEAVKNYIEENYMLPITVESIAAKLHLHRSHLQKVFKKNTGTTIRQYIISVRLTKARELLLAGKNVTETAYLCGFSNQAHLSNYYKKLYGQPPTFTIKSR